MVIFVTKSPNYASSRCVSTWLPLGQIDCRGNFLDETVMSLNAKLVRRSRPRGKEFLYLDVSCQVEDIEEIWLGAPFLAAWRIDKDPLSQSGGMVPYKAKSSFYASHTRRPKGCSHNVHFLPNKHL